MNSIECHITLSCRNFSCRNLWRGHVVLYQAPWVFQTLFNMVKPLLDPVTAGKVVFVSGDDSPGSDNDKKMQWLIGPNWRELTNAGT